MKLGLDLSKVEVKQGGQTDVIPAGSYSAKVLSVDLNEKGNTVGLKTYFEITNTQYSGSVVMSYINIRHTNKEAERIGLESLKKIATFGGHSNPNKINDTNELIGLEVGLKVVDGEFQGDNGPIKTSQVKNYFKIDKTAGDNSKSSSSQSSAESNTKKNPWD